MIFRLILTFFISLSTLTACKNAEKAETTDPTTQPQINTDLMGDPQGMFPYVFMGENNSVMFEAYTMKFQLTHERPMMPATNNSIPWINAENYSEDNGVFVSYIHNGKELSLRSPNFRVEYINKRLPYCSSVDSIYIWLDQRFLTVDGSEVLTKPTRLETQAGKQAVYKAYYTPKHMGARGEIEQKYTAFAYLDYDEDYHIAFNLSAITRPEFEELEETFVRLVKSFAYL